MSESEESDKLLKYFKSSNSEYYNTHFHITLINKLSIKQKP